MDQIKNFIQTHIVALQTFGWLALKVLVLIFIGWYLAHFLSARVKKVLIKRDDILATFSAQVVFISIMILTVITVLGTLGVQIASILAVVGTAGLAIALALKDSLSSIASGIILIVLRPFKIGDQVEIGGISGKVESLNLFNTTLCLADDKIAILPNRNIASANIVNATKSPIGRIEWVCGVGYGSDIQKVRDVITDVLLSMENTDKSKGVFVGVTALSASSIDFTIRIWAKREDGIFAVRSKMIERVKEALDHHKIEIPYNKLDVMVKN